MFIPVTCGCGKALRVAETIAGKKVRCPGCQGAVQVPGPVAAVAVAEPPPRRRTRRRVVAPLERGPLPGGAIALTILTFLDAAIVGFLGVGLLLIGGMASSSDTLLDASADQAVQGIREEGGQVTDDRVISRDGARVRHIEYRTKDGGTGMMEIPVQAPKEMKNVGGMLVLLGVLLLITSGGRALSGLFLLLKKNGGRMGLIAMSGFQLLLVLLGVMAGGVGAYLWFSLVLSIAVIATMSMSSVRAAVR